MSKGIEKLVGLLGMPGFHPGGTVLAMGLSGAESRSLEQSHTHGDHVSCEPGKIRPFQQMISSCSGALLVSVFVTPLDVVKIRLQTQRKMSSNACRPYSSCTSQFLRKRLASVPVTPLDVVKIRLQTQHKPLQRGQCFLYCNGLMDHICMCVNGQSMKPPWYKMPGHFNGTFDAFTKIIRAEGVSSLWSGLPPTLVMAVPATVIYFTTYDQLKYSMGFREGVREKLWIPAVAGSIARVIAASVISPIELIRTKMQSTQLSYRDVGVAVKDAVSQGGIRSLWAGLGPTILRDVPFSAVYWLGFEAIKSYSKVNEKGELSFSQNFMAGATSGTVAAVLTLPFDVIKTHRQIELGEASLTDKRKTRSTLLLMRNIYRNQGIGGLFTGIVPRLIKVTPACAIMISSYEYGKSFFRTYNAEALANDFK